MNSVKAFVAGNDFPGRVTHVFFREKKWNMIEIYCCCILKLINKLFSCLIHLRDSGGKNGYTQID